MAESKPNESIADRAEDSAERVGGESPAMKAQMKKMASAGEGNGKPKQMKKTESSCKKAPYSRGY